MKYIPKLYIDNPEFCGTYTCDGYQYILIENIPKEKNFFCYAIKLNAQGQVHISDKRTEPVFVNVIRK